MTKDNKSKYAQAGVDFNKEHNVVDVMVDAGSRTLDNLKDLEKKGIVKFPEEGSDFAGGLELKINGKFVLSGGVDGPGSKPVVHAIYNKYGGRDEVKNMCTAIDSIAMCTNDLICSGARPLIIYEYHSWHNINEKIAEQMKMGKVIAAELSKAAILGGENASLPVMITGPVPATAYDMCNTAVGIITDKELIEKPLGKNRVQEGDAVIGLSSSGIHCNGITLAWKTAIEYDEKTLFWKNRFRKDYKLMEQISSLNGESPAEAILTPTTIYVETILEVLEKYGSGIKAIANITGEGVGNMFRILPKGTGLKLDYSIESCSSPHAIFPWIQSKADVSTREMYQDYNMGTGMILVIDPKIQHEVIDSIDLFSKLNFTKSWQRHESYELGKVVRDKYEHIEIKAFDGTEHRYGRK